MAYPELVNVGLPRGWTDRVDEAVAAAGMARAERLRSAVRRGLALAQKGAATK